MTTRIAETLADVGNAQDDAFAIFTDGPVPNAALAAAKTPEERLSAVLDVIVAEDESETHIEEDLEAVGIRLTAPSALEAAQRQAAASQFLRRAARHRSRIATVEAARDMEVALIVSHYDAEIARERSAAEKYEVAVEILAELSAAAGDFGRKKSAKTPYGTFGFREQGESYELADRVKLLDYAREHAPEFVKAELTLPLAEARQYFTDAELTEKEALDVQWGEFKKVIDAADDLPPGVTIKPSSRTYFAKPAVGSLDGLQVRA